MEWRGMMWCDAMGCDALPCDASMRWICSEMLDQIEVYP